jgi:hypothetical protein
MKELIKEAKRRKEEIAKMIQQDNGGNYVAIYESDNGFTLSTIREGHHTRRNQLSFSDYNNVIFSTPLEQVEKEISDAEFYHNL